MMGSMRGQDRGETQGAFAKKQARQRRLILDQQTFDQVAASSVAHLEELERKNKAQ